MSAIIKIQESDLTKYDLSAVQTDKVMSAFTPSIESIKTHDEEFLAILAMEQSLERSKRAGELRKKLVKERTAITPIHKEQKAFYLNGGRFVDGFKNTIVGCIEKAEDDLENIEDYYVNIEKERVQKLRDERANLLVPFEYVNTGNIDFGLMTQDEFDIFARSAKTIYDEKVQKDLDEKNHLANIEKENENLRAQIAEKDVKIESQNEIIQTVTEEKAQVIAEKSEVVEKAQEIIKSIPELISAIEAYNFTCVAGKLQNCSHWQKLKSLIS